MKKDLLNSVIGKIKQGIIDVEAKDATYISFKNNDINCHILASCGGYSVIFDSINDRLIVVWCLKIWKSCIDGSITGGWGNGHYFDNNGGNDIIERYNIDDVANLFIEKGLGL